MTEPRDIVLPTGYTDLLGELKGRVRAARTRALRTVNTQLIELYWSIGKAILVRQDVEDWGSGVIGRLADDLRAEFPEMKGLSRSNLFYMRGFAAAWPDPIVQQPAGQLPGGTSWCCWISLIPLNSVPGTQRLPSSTAGPATCS